MSDKKPSEWARAEAMNIWVEIGAHEAGSAQDHIAIRLDAARAEGAREAVEKCKRLVAAPPAPKEKYDPWDYDGWLADDRARDEKEKMKKRIMDAFDEMVAALRATPAAPADAPEVDVHGKPNTWRCDRGFIGPEAGCKMSGPCGNCWHYKPDNAEWMPAPERQTCGNCGHGPLDANSRCTAEWGCENKAKWKPRMGEGGKS
jgi:hypothetical protein